MENADFIKVIKDAALKAFSNLRSSHPEEDFCAFGLYSDEGAMTVCPSANTTSFLEKKIKEDPEDTQYYKWSTAEWKYEFSGHEWFTDVSAEISKFHSTKHNNKDFIKFQKNLFESCVAALEQLKSENFFGNCILVFSVTDYTNNKKEISWISRLNNPREASNFKKWINEQDE